MKFEDRPDAQFLRKLYKDLFYRLGYEHDYIFDWMIKKTDKGKPLKMDETVPGDEEEKKEGDDIVKEDEPVD